MMRKRQKQKAAIYPKWGHQESPANQCRERDGLACFDCGVEQYTILISATTGAPYILYLHASHLHPLDPDPVEPIEGQRLRARCPRCHRLYDMDWQRREDETEHQRRLHGILVDRFFMKRFTEIQ